MKTDITDHERDELVQLAIKLEDFRSAEAAAFDFLELAKQGLSRARADRSAAEFALAGRLRAVTDTMPLECTPALLIGRHAWFADRILPGDEGTAGPIKRLEVAI